MHAGAQKPARGVRKFVPTKACLSLNGSQKTSSGSLGKITDKPIVVSSMPSPDLHSCFERPVEDSVNSRDRRCQTDLSRLLAISQDLSALIERVFSSLNTSTDTSVHHTFYILTMNGFDSIQDRFYHLDCYISSQ